MEDLGGAWHAIWGKYASKKPAMQSQTYVPDEIVEQFINGLNDICANMANDPGEVMKKTQVIQGIWN